MFGFIIIIMLGVGCLSLAAKGFSEDGLPFTNTRNITGMPAKIIGVFCGLLGLGFLGIIVVGLIGILLDM